MPAAQAVDVLSGSTGLGKANWKVGTGTGVCEKLQSLCGLTQSRAQALAVPVGRREGLQGQSCIVVRHLLVMWLTFSSIPDFARVP